MSKHTPGLEKLLTKHWTDFLKSKLVVERHFTKVLYQAISLEPGFIAHFNREGFIKARFHTLADFDYTISTISKSRRLGYLVDAIGPDLLAQVRYAVASREAALLTQQAKVLDWHVSQLQRKFQKKLI